MTTAFTLTVLTTVAPALLATGEMAADATGAPWMMCQRVVVDDEATSTRPELTVEAADPGSPMLPIDEPASARMCRSAIDPGCALQAPSGATTTQLQSPIPVLRPSAVKLGRLSVPVDELAWVVAGRARSGYARDIDEPPRSPISTTTTGIRR